MNITINKEAGAQAMATTVATTVIRSYDIGQHARGYIEAATPE
jgi:hypothetical protein